MGSEMCIRDSSCDVFVHAGRVERGELALGDTVKAQVDRACRRRAQANHTATHLLQAALKQVVDQASARPDHWWISIACASTSTAPRR